MLFPFCSEGFLKDHPLFFHNPHAVLGWHVDSEGLAFIRLWNPSASQVFLQIKDEIVEAFCLDHKGLFEVKQLSNVGPFDYKVYDDQGALVYDPYVFASTFTDYDTHLFSLGTHYQLHEKLGAHLCQHQGVKGVKFSVWAPNAISVALVGDFNSWDGRRFPMRNLGQSGVWEIFIPNLQKEQRYKFEVRDHKGDLKLKTDPFGNLYEKRPQTAALVVDTNEYVWNDLDWMKKRSEISLRRPIHIYEVHLGSWQKGLNYRDLAEKLAIYCQEHAFTHVELLPVMEHPLDESWGYQVTGFFAPTSRYGHLTDFQYFVDYMHQKGIGVILDWVPGHFPKDDFALENFDGTCLYEHADPKKGWHPDWHTYIFNYGRHEVSNFLIASALFWLNSFHVDGFRVDAVASMLYLDYGKKEGEWIPNAYGGHHNLEAIEFLKHLNSIIHTKYPGVLMIAEESTSFPLVSHDLSEGGLGFDLKWNMGWMNDSLHYFRMDPVYRGYHQNSLTFGLCYAFSERFILPLSHDEVVHEKKSLLSKMPGDEWRQFAQLRLLHSYMICYPGKKLSFMGFEMAQKTEWNCKEELPWFLLSIKAHSQFSSYFKRMNHFYLQREELWAYDFDERGFEWVDFSDSTNSVISYLRKSDHCILFCVHNFTPNFISSYFVPLKNIKMIKEVFNSDSIEYGGSNQINHPVDVIDATGCTFTLAPLATIVFEVSFVC